MRSTPRRVPLDRAAAVLCALAASAVLAAQDPPQPPGPAPKPPTPLEGLHGQEAGEEEILALFGRVERRLREIDRMLYDASSGGGLGRAEESGIGKLLEASRQASQRVLDEIDRILELAQRRAQQQQQQGGGSQPGEQQDGSPLDRQQGQPGEREQTPDGQSPGTERDDQPGDGGRPESPRDSRTQGDNREGDSPPQGSTERVPPGGGDERWGDLPIHVRDLFRAQGGGDLPPRYRDWIDAYYRRLNQRP